MLFLYMFVLALSYSYLLQNLQRKLLHSSVLLVILKHFPRRNADSAGDAADRKKRLAIPFPGVGGGLRVGGDITGGNMTAGAGGGVEGGQVLAVGEGVEAIKSKPGATRSAPEPRKPERRNPPTPNKKT